MTEHREFVIKYCIMAKDDGWEAMLTMLIMFTMLIMLTMRQESDRGESMPEAIRLPSQGRHDKPNILNSTCFFTPPLFIPFPR